jgi:hypothetical protein
MLIHSLDVAVEEVVMIYITNLNNLNIIQKKLIKNAIKFLQNNFYLSIKKEAT